MQPTGRAWVYLGGFAALLVAALFALPVVLQKYGSANEVSLPILAIAGVLVLLGGLALVSIAFSLMNMSDRTEALGLPAGSIRAVIALSLIVLFAILTVFLFTSLEHGGKVQKLACLTAADKDAFVRNLGAQQVLLAFESGVSTTGETCPRPSNAPAGTTPALFTVYYGETGDVTSRDFAKQLLVLIGTLVTAVSSFYFGARAVSEAHAAATPNPPPSLVGISPTTVAVGGALTPLRITGTNLNSVQHAQLVSSISGPAPIVGTGVVSNPTEVQAQFQLPATATANTKWDVVVTDFLGRTARLPAALQVA